jgi:ATP-binding cassette subfamily B multidrug efflux pump
VKQVFRLIRFIRPYGKKCLLAVALLLGMVAMDLAIPRLVERIIDQGIIPRHLEVIFQTFLFMLGVSILDTLFAVGNNLLSIQVGEGVLRDLREALFLKIQSFSFGNLDRINTGQLMVRLTSDVSVFQRLVHISLRIGTRAPLLMIGSVLLMFNTDPRLALTISPLLLVTLILIVFFVSRMGNLFQAALQKLDRLNTILQENIAGVRVVKAFVRAKYEARKFADSNEDYTERNTKVMRFMATMGPAMSICVNVGIVLVIWAGGFQAINGRITIGQIVAFVNYLLAILSPLSSMVNLGNVWAAAIASAGRINSVLDETPDVQDIAGAVSLFSSDRPRVAFRDVSFRYADAKDGKVLENINLVAEPGETVAILGATGAGKSTLVNMISRFYDATTGQVMVDDEDVREIKQESLLSQIGYVPQETVLFSGSVKYNIRYGRPEASDEEVIAAAKAAQAHEFILRLPRGYETHVEERGVNFSGGQKQRIAIARALLVRPAILVLDDSTSSVDVETETKIQAAIHEWMRPRVDSSIPAGICFVVAQRMSTVLKADKIIVLEEGHIAAQGTHRELLQSSQAYQEIYSSQLGNGLNGCGEYV